MTHRRVHPHASSSCRRAGLSGRPGAPRRSTPRSARGRRGLARLGWTTPRSLLAADAAAAHALRPADQGSAARRRAAPHPPAAVGTPARRYRAPRKLRHRRPARIRAEELLAEAVSLLETTPPGTNSLARSPTSARSSAGPGGVQKRGVPLRRALELARARRCHAARGPPRARTARCRRPAPPDRAHRAGRAHQRRTAGRRARAPRPVQPADRASTCSSPYPPSKPTCGIPSKNSTSPHGQTCPPNWPVSCPPHPGCRSGYPRGDRAPARRSHPPSAGFPERSGHQSGLEQWRCRRAELRLLRIAIYANRIAVSRA